MGSYYDPMLFASTPRHPSTMGVMATLTEPVDGEILRKAVEELRERFPYFYVRVADDNNNLTIVPNPLPMTVRNTWGPALLHSEEANYHMAAFKYEGNSLALEISHILTDGSGAVPFFKSVLYGYLTRTTGEHFDPAGFRLPGDPIPGTETGNPFEGMDLDSVTSPFYKKKVAPGFYSLNDTLSVKPEGGKNIYFKIPEERVMAFCKENDGSPNVLLSVLLANAVRRMDPGSNKTVVSAVAINHKAILGNHDNYRAFSDLIFLDFPKKMEHDSLTKKCTVARGQLMLQSQPENSLFYMKDLKSKYELMQKAPWKLKSAMIDLVLSFSRGTFGVSYANSGSFGPLDPYIRELFFLAEPDVLDVQIEIANINGSFCLLFAQNFLSEVFFDAFLSELEEIGITAEIVRKDQCPLSGVRFDGIGEEAQETLRSLFRKVIPPKDE